MHRILYILKSFGFGRVLAYALFYPFRNLSFFKDRASRVRREMRSHLMIYDVGLKIRTGEKKLSFERRNEIKQYFRGYGIKINTTWHETFFATNGIDSNYYLPEFLFYEFIEPAFNDQKTWKNYTDKNMYSRHFPGIRQPKTFLRYMNGAFFDADYGQTGIKSGLNNLKEHEDPLFIKPSIDSGKGRNVNLLTVKKEKIFLNETRITTGELLKLYENGFIVQEKVKQFHQLSELHPDSLNTMRVFTFRFNDEIRVLSSRLRMGRRGNYIDTFDGMNCNVAENGKLDDVGYNEYLQQHRTHPYSGKAFSTVTIPRFKELRDTIMGLHKSIKNIDIASWDIAIDTTGEPVLIEVNLRYQGILKQQVVAGPIFRDLTDEVLAYVFL